MVLAERRFRLMFFFAADASPPWARTWFCLKTPGSFGPKDRPSCPVYSIFTRIFQSATGPGVSGDWSEHLAAYLYCGVTSVVDYGPDPEALEPMRRLVQSGAIEGPRLHLAVRMTTPGGHGAEGGRGESFTLEVQTPREARDAVRRVLSYRPDVIKVFTDGWRYNTAPDMTSMNQETLSALVEEAHKNGILVLTHTVTVERAKIAARASVDVIVHGMGDREADNEVIGLMRAKGTAYVSTLAVYEPRGRGLLSPLLSAVLEPAVREAVFPFAGRVVHDEGRKSVPAGSQDGPNHSLRCLPGSGRRRAAESTLADTSP